MDKYDIISLAQNFLLTSKHHAQVYPSQDYFLSPVGNQYGTPSAIPFPHKSGFIAIDCAFDVTGNCCYVFKHSSWHNYFSGSKLITTQWKEAKPTFIVTLVLVADDPTVNLDSIASELKAELITRAKPCENG